MPKKVTPEPAVEPRFSTFDPHAPYYIREPYPLYAEDAGPWPDLLPSRVASDGRLELGDGPERELLYRCRIGKPIWSAASAGDRKLIKAALATHMSIENAIRDLLDPGGNTRDRARTYLLRAAESWESSLKDRRGYARDSARRFGVPIAHQVLDGIRQILSEARAKARAEDGDLKKSEIDGYVARTNEVLRLSQDAPLRRVCTKDDIKAAILDRLPVAERVNAGRRDRGVRVARGPQDVALSIVARAMSALSPDDIRRRQPRRRG